MKQYILFVVALLVLLYFWLSYDPTTNFSRSLAGEDNRGVVVAPVEAVKIGEHFTTFSEFKEKANLDDWPRFRGENLDNISTKATSFSDNWQKNPPEIMWQVKLGEGHAGAAIEDGYCYVLDYIEEEKQDALRCFDLESGDEIWRRAYNVHIKRNHGMSRTVPSISGEKVVTIGPKGQVMCVNRKSGDLLWTLDMVAKYNTKLPQWYTAQCPLIYGKEVVLSPGGDAVMIGVDLENGTVNWEVSNTMKWKMSHSSIVPMTIDGVEMFVYSADGGICGIAAERSERGTLLWQTNKWNHSVVAPCPVLLPDGKIFLTAGYGAGGMVIQVRKSDKGTFETEVLSEYKARKGLACEQQTPLLYNDHLLGILPKDAGTNRNQLVCYHHSDVQNPVWKSGTSHRFGLGPFLIADNKIYILSDDGTLTIAEASTQNYKELGTIKLFDGHDAWAPIAVADGNLLLRDADVMYCVKVSK